MLLGLYLYSRNTVLRDAINKELCVIADNNPLTPDEARRSFADIWLLVATYHDQGYVYEIDLPDGERESELQKVHRELNLFFEAPLHRYLPDYFGVGLVRTTELRARYGLQLPQSLRVESFDDLLIQPVDGSSTLQVIESLIESCQLGRPGKALSAYLDMARHTRSNLSNRPPYVDHGLASAVLLVRCHQELTSYCDLLVSRDASGDLRRFYTADGVRDAIQTFSKRLASSGRAIRHAAAAIALHNIDPHQWNESVSAGPLYGLTLSNYTIRLSKTPLAFLLGLSDTLQDWDRPRFSLPQAATDYIRIDQHMLMSASADHVFLTIHATNSADGQRDYEKAKAALKAYLEPAEIDRLLKPGAKITYPDRMFRGSIDEAAAKARLERQRAVEELNQHWKDYENVVERTTPPEETRVEQRARRARHFRLFLEWCREKKYDYLRPSEDSAMNAAYSKILAEINDLNFVMVGTIIGGRTVELPLGYGGYGQVFRVLRADGTHEALKIFHTSNFKEAELADRFRRGYLSMQSLSHNQITKVYEFNEIPRGYFMDYIDGDNLARYLRETGKASSAAERLELFLDICSVIDYAHNQTVIHRDIKPENILIRWSVDKNRFEPVLTDFDLAWFTQAAAITLSGAEVVGSILYAAPEQKRVHVDTNDVRRPTVDIFSLGRLMYFLFASRRPEEDLDLAATLAEVIQHRYRDVKSKAFAIGMREIYRKATRLSPDERYQSVREFIVALETVQAALVEGDGILSDDAAMLELGVRFSNNPDFNALLKAAQKRRCSIQLSLGNVIECHIDRSLPDKHSLNIQMKLISDEATLITQKKSFAEARSILNNRLEKAVSRMPFEVVDRGSEMKTDYRFWFRIALPNLTMNEVAKLEASLNILRDSLNK